MHTNRDAAQFCFQEKSIVAKTWGCFRPTPKPSDYRTNLRSANAGSRMCPPAVADKSSPRKPLSLQKKPSRGYTHGTAATVFQVAVLQFILVPLGNHSKNHSTQKHIAHRRQATASKVRFSRSSPEKPCRVPSRTLATGAPQAPAARPADWLSTWPPQHESSSPQSATLDITPQRQEKAGQPFRCGSLDHCRPKPACRSRSARHHS
jgi:hypothetical protein